MYGNRINRDLEDKDYVTIKLHQRQVSNLLAALHSLRVRKEENLQSAHVNEPSLAALNELAALMSLANALSTDTNKS